MSSPPRKNAGKQKTKTKKVLPKKRAATRAVVALPRNNCAGNLHRNARAGRPQTGRKGVARSVRAAQLAPVRGMGGYFSDNGGALGSWVGKQGGRALGGLIDSVFGLGAYNVRENSLVSLDSVRYQPGGPPRVINAKKGEATVFGHREFVGDIRSSTIADVSGNAVFKLEEWSLNPGNSKLFPWLALMGQGFQEYRIQGMLVELISESSTFAQNLALGSVMLAADYNPLADPPANKIAMLELEYSSACKTSDNIIMPVECAFQNDSETHLYIALDSDYHGADARTFDMGKIFVATQGQPALDAKIAEMWVTYEIALYKPKIPESSFGGEGGHVVLSGCTTNVPLANGIVMTGSTPGIYVDSAADLLYLPRGENKWLVVCSWKGAIGAGYTAYLPIVYNDGTDDTCVLEDAYSTATGPHTSKYTDLDEDNPGYGSITSFVVSGKDNIVPRVGLISGAFPAVSVRGDVWVARLPPDISFQ